MSETRPEQLQPRDLTTTLVRRLPAYDAAPGGGVPPGGDRAAPRGHDSSNLPTMPEQHGSGQANRAVALRPDHQLPMLSVSALRADGAPGQTFFIRGDMATCGRDACEIQIANDPLMSKRHFELARLEHEGEQLWEIRDLESSGGLWIRVDKAWLYKSAEICLGNTRFRFVAEAECGPDRPAANRDVTQVIDTTALQGGSVLRRLPRGGVAGRDFLLKKRDKPYWVGTDPQAEILCEEDEFVDHRHAVVEFDQGTRRWKIEDRGSVNGLWIRRSTHRVSYQNPELIVRAGEQVFILRMDSHA